MTTKEEIKNRKLAIVKYMAARLSNPSYAQGVNLRCLDRRLNLPREWIAYYLRDLKKKGIVINPLYDHWCLSDVAKRVILKHFSVI